MPKIRKLSKKGKTAIKALNKLINIKKVKYYKLVIITAPESAIYMTFYDEKKHKLDFKKSKQ